MKIWIFGQSMCLPHRVEECQAWPYLLSQKLNTDYENFSQHGADNLFIYHTFLENYSKIAADDLIIVGWSHPNRKSFVLDSQNPAHQTVLDRSLIYETETQTFFRNNNTTPSTKSKWLTLQPRPSGSEFYDVWFRNYYSEYEQQCNFQSYMDSVQLRVPEQYIPFYFSQESVAQISRQNDNFMLEFVINNNLAIDKNDLHLNSTGHQMWADLLLEQIQK
jgi:hypothetical protein